MVAPLREHFQEYHYTAVTLEENIVAVITQGRVIDDNLKRQIKNETLCSCRLFLITKIFQDIGQLFFIFWFTDFFTLNLMSEYEKKDLFQQFFFLDSRFLMSENKKK